MAEWTGTLTFSDQTLKNLEAFIREPDTRQGDIFDQGTLQVDDEARLDWIIKHDLFQGVVVNLSLMTEDGSAFLAGEEDELAHAEELLKTYTFSHDNHSYTLAIQPE